MRFALDDDALAFPVVVRFVCEQVTHRVPKRDLVVRQGKPHALGNPNTRSAAMLRWISFVPA